jgi:hypothetical protein
VCVLRIPRHPLINTNCNNNTNYSNNDGENILFCFLKQSLSLFASILIRGTTMSYHCIVNDPSYVTTSMPPAGNNDSPATCTRVLLLKMIVISKDLNFANIRAFELNFRCIRIYGFVFYVTYNYF